MKSPSDPVRDAVAVLALLAQVVQRGQHLGAGLVGVDLDVVADRVRREEPDHPVGGQPLLLDQGVEHLLGVVVQLAGGLARDRVVEDVGEPALHLPGVEERLPVDVLAQLGEVVVERTPARRGPGRAPAACSRPTRSASGSRGPSPASASAARSSGRAVRAALRSRSRWPPAGPDAACRRAARRRPAPSGRRP